MTPSNSVNYDGQGIELIDAEPRTNFDADFEAAALIPDFTELKKGGVLIGCIVKNEGLGGTDFYIQASHKVENFEGSNHMRSEVYLYETEYAFTDAQEVEYYNEAYQQAINDLGIDDERD